MMGGGGGGEGAAGGITDGSKKLMSKPVKGEE